MIIFKAFDINNTYILPARFTASITADSFGFGSACVTNMEVADVCCDVMEFPPTTAGEFPLIDAVAAILRSTCTVGCEGFWGCWMVVGWVFRIGVVEEGVLVADTAWR